MSRPAGEIAACHDGAPWPEGLVAAAREAECGRRPMLFRAGCTS